MSPGARRWARRLVLLLSAAALAVGALRLALRPAGRIDFLLHRDRYEEVVRGALKACPAGEPGHEVSLSTDGIEVAARHDGPGQYTIALDVFDRHHLGRSGYLFSDAPPRRIEGDPYLDVDAPGGYWHLGEQVAPRWWVISSNLD